MTSLNSRIGFIQGRSLKSTPANVLQVYPSSLDLVFDEFSYLKESPFSYIELFEPEIPSSSHISPSSIDPSVLQSLLDISSSRVTALTYDPVLAIDSLASLKLCLDRFYFLLDNLSRFSPFHVVLPLVASACPSTNPYVQDFLADISAQLTSHSSILIESNLEPQQYLDFLHSFPFSFYVAYDTGNRFHPSLDYTDDINSLLPYIKHVHLKDKRHGKNTYIGTGLVPFDKILSSLELVEHPYTGFYTFEAIRGLHPRQSLLHYFNYISSLL